MAVLVTGRAAALSELLDLWDGEVLAAPALTNAIAALQGAPVATWVPVLRAAATADLHDVPNALYALPHFAPDAKLLLARRLGWLVDMLFRCPADQGAARSWMEVAAVAAACWDDDGGFWTAVRSRRPIGAAVPAALEAVLRGRSPQIANAENAPVYERESVDALHRADLVGDWPSLVESSTLFRNLPCLDPGARAAALGLLSLDLPRLVRIVGGARTWMGAHMVLGALPLADALRVATATNNGHARFAALERAAHRERRALTRPETLAARNLLVSLSIDDQWTDWLQVFNRYPVRCPQFQTALGLALARSRPAALAAYIDSLPLGTTEEGGRREVTTCLTTFRSHAGPSRRQVLWRAAFERWSTWDYGASADANLTSLARCELDYGVIGWLVEGQALGPFEDAEMRFDRELRLWDARWHSSVSSAHSDVLRLLSEYQLRAHAQRRTARDADWLPDLTIYRPKALEGAFAARRYGTGRV